MLMDFIGLNMWIVVCSLGFDYLLVVFLLLRLGFRHELFSWT
jgi:hypothetical protein